MTGLAANGDDPREALVEAACALAREGLNHGAAGNVSVRDRDGFLITPSGVLPEYLDASMIAALDPDGERRSGDWAPSSEWRLHRDLYRARPGIAAIVHAHPPHATAIACLREPIPALHYMVALAGGAAIPIAEYQTFGTQALSTAACAALAEIDACLLANHGMVALGADLGAALRLAAEVEALAQVFLLARAAGDPVILDDDEMARVRERFAGYGRPRGA